jgi:hypothetical protein
MTISSTTTFNLTSDQLVAAAMRKLAVLGDGQSPSVTQLSNGTQALNVMLKSFTTKGMPLWVMSEYSITPTASTTYTMGIGQTINIPAPLKVTQVLRREIDTSVPMTVKSHYDYNLLSNFTNAGVPTCYWYEPLNQTGVLHVWPLPDDTTIADSTFVMVYQRPFYDMVSGTDTLDFPQYWQEAVIYGLAHRLSPEYGVPIQDRQLIGKEAEFFLSEALSFGTEEGSIYFAPEWRDY